jgi:hypothetical protein
MTLITFISLGLIAISSIPSLALQAQVSPIHDKDPPQVLTWKTGWIELGAISADMKEWAAGSDHSVDFLTGGFEIVGRRVDRRKPVLPKIGERIRLTTRNEITILDYASTGEKRRLEVPFSVARSLGRNDRTGLWLEPGDIVEVLAVRISRPYGEVRTAWARVSVLTK